MNFVDKVYLSLKALFFVIIVCASFFLLFQNVLTVTFDLTPQLDELIIVSMVILWAFKTLDDPLSKKAFLLFLILFFFLFVISYSAIPHRGISRVSIQILIHLKFLIFLGFVNAYMPKSIALSLVGVFLTATIAFMLFELAYPTTMYQVFGEVIKSRQGVIRPIGIQGHTANLGASIAFLGAFYICLIKKEKAILKAGVAVTFFILVFFTSARTAFILFPIILFWMLRGSVKNIFIVGVVSLSLIFVVSSSQVATKIINITQKNIANTVEDPVESGYIRGIMVYFSFEIANERFPLGTGAATFGTVMSDESAVYVDLGVDKSQFFIEKEGIYDSNFASLLGEFGYLGVFVYFLLFARVIRLYLGGFTAESYEFFLVFTALLLFYSLTNPVFMNTITAFLASILIRAAHNSTDNNRSQANKTQIMESF
ncbi:hypothetical protein [Pseudoalteromonas ruthenica]|uniref:hypothetical protein n=1 Tax=Pseudoalteromonas ruthenica TaxID=151081 RepID=UPI000347DF11|nr:hypothetical protein [Pseudoalteromonas ruthenica]